MIGEIFPYLRKDTSHFYNDETKPNPNHDEIEKQEEEMMCILEQLKIIVSHKNWVRCYRIKPQYYIYNIETASLKMRIMYEYI